MKLREIKRSITESNIMLTEALSLDTARKYTSIERNPAIQNRLNTIFNKLANLKSSKAGRRNDRIYIPLKKKKTSTDDASRIEIEIHDAISQSDYFTGVKDYIKGIAVDKYGRETTIGKALNKIGRQDLMQAFNNDDKRKGKQASVDSYLVFSKHPYDVAGQSTDRGWTSCMNIYTGSNKQYVQHDIKEGTIICYLVSSNDLNIEKPIARILIKPFINVSNSDDVIYRAERAYGTAPENFKDQVQNIIDKIQGEKFGKFELASSLYCDTISNFTVLNPKIQSIFDGRTKANTKELITQICNILNIKDYTINEDLSVDVNRDVTIQNENLKVIPINFRHVSGDFYCSDNNLTFLEGAPQKVSGDFYCSGNDLTSLEGAPQKVSGDFDCSSNNLTSLKGAPQKVSGNFYCSNNNLTSLEGAPQKVNGDFSCSYNNLTSLKGAPQKVDGGFNCSNNNLTSLKGVPQKVDGGFNCSNNNLTSLKGVPQKVIGRFNCSSNNLTSLKGAPQKVNGDFSCSYNNLTSLEGAPQKVDGGFYCVRNRIKFTKDQVRKVSDVQGNIFV